ncbi:MAG: tetratricopeptide repeat protein [Chloroflexi bacterium]|nr:tetratricopeptide repeat protein [Chloroflexota bacterium]
MIRKVPLALLLLACGLALGLFVATQGVLQAAPPPPAYQELLQRGYASQEQGDIPAARAAYQALLDNPAAAHSARDEALFRLGLIAYQEGDWAAASAAMRPFAQDPLAVALRPEVHYLLAQMARQEGNWSEAASQLEAYLSAAPVLSDMLHLQVADAYAQQAQPQQAILHYQAALQSPYSSPYRILAALAGAQLNANRPAEALATWQAAFNRAPADASRATALFAIANLTNPSGGISLDAAKYSATLQSLVTRYPATSQGYQAMLRLEQMGLPLAPYTRGLIAFNSGNYVAAQVSFQAATAADTSFETDAYYYLGRTLRRLKHLPEAITALKTYVESNPKKEQAANFGAAYLELASAYLDQGNETNAVQVYQRLATDYVDLPQAETALWRLVERDEVAHALLQAIPRYQSLAEHFPQSNNAIDARFMQGLSYYRLRDCANAPVAWQFLADNPNPEVRSRGLYWQARCAQGQQRQEAQRLAQQAAAADPSGYYSLLAQSMLSSPGPILEDVSLAGDDGSAAALERWLVGWANSQQTPDWQALDREIQNQPHYQRGVLLLRMQLFDQARQEFNTLLDIYKQTPLANYRLALLLSGMGQYRQAIPAAVRVAALAPARRLSLSPLYLRRLAYPVPYAALMADTARQYHIDPALLVSLVRQESAFDAQAVSSAQAQGLTQVVPATAKDIAGHLDIAAFRQSDLFRPLVSLRFGAYYLAVQLKGRPSEFQALAAYNAGGTNAWRWTGLVDGEDPQVFVELIDFPETQRYVRWIAENLAQYRFLYPDLFPAEKVSVSEIIPASGITSASTERNGS